MDAEDLRSQVSKLTAQLEAREVDLEQAQVQHAQKLGAYEKEVVLLHEQNQRLSRALDDKANFAVGLEAKLQTAEHVLQERTEMLGQCKKEKAELQKSIDASVSRQAQYDVELHQKDSSIQSYSQELLEHKTSLAHTRKELSQVEGRVRPLELQLQQAQSQSSMLNDEVRSLQSQLSAKTKEFTHMHKQMLEQRTSLESKLREEHHQSSRLLVELEEAKDAERRGQRQNESLRSKILEAEERIRALETDFRGELESLKRLSELYKQSYEEEKDRNCDMSQQLESLRTDTAQQQEELKRLQDTCSTLEEEQRQNAPLLLTDKEYDADSVNLSLSECYGKYVTAMEMLQKERQTTQELTAYLEQIRREVDVQTPVIRRERQESARLRSAYEALQQQSFALQKHVREVTGTCHALEKTAQQTEQRALNAEAEQQVLQRQVAKLLGRTVDDGFTNVEELLATNQELRGRLRKLETQQSLVPVRSEKPLEVRYQDQRQRFDDLQRRFEEQEDRLSDTTHELMMLKLVLKEDGVPAIGYKETNPSDNNAQLVETMTQERSGLLREMEEMRRAATTLQVEQAQTVSRLEYQTQKTEDAAQRQARAEKELFRFQADVSRAKEIVAHMESQLERARSELNAAHDRTAELEQELARIRARAEACAASEARLLQELEGVSAHRSSMERMLESLVAAQDRSTLRDEAEAAAQKEREALKEQLQAREETIEELRTYQTRQREEAETRRQAMERERDALRGQVNAAKESVIELTSARDAVARRVEELEKDNSILREQVSVLIHGHTRTQVDLSGASLLSGEEKLQLDHDSLSANLDSMSSSLAEVQEQARTWKSMCQNTETKLKALQDVHEQLKQTSNASIGKLVEQRERLQKRIADLVASAQDQDSAYHALEEEKSALMSAMDRQKEDIESFRGESKRTRAEFDRLKEAAQVEQNAAAEAQRRYEAEVIEHGSDLMAVRSIKEELSEAKQRLATQERELAAERCKIASTMDSSSSQISSLEQEVQRSRDLVASLRLENEQLLRSKDISLDESAVLERLRKERELAETRAEQGERECRRLRFEVERLEGTVRALEKQVTESIDAKSVNVVAASVSELKGLSVLRESNEMLRHQLQEATKELNDVTTEYREMEDSVEPLQAEAAQLKSKAHALEAALAAAESAIESWKTRCENMVKKYNHVDKEVYDQVVTDLEGMRGELERMKVEAVENKEQKSDVQEQLAESQATISSLETQLLSLQSSGGTMGRTALSLLEKLKRMLVKAKRLLQQRDEAIAKGDALVTFLGKQKQAAIKEAEAAAKKLAEVEHAGNGSDQRLHKLEAQLLDANQKLEASRRDVVLNKMASKRAFAEERKALETQIQELKEHLPVSLGKRGHTYDNEASQKKQRTNDSFSTESDNQDDSDAVSQASEDPEHGSQSEKEASSTEKAMEASDGQTADALEDADNVHAESVERSDIEGVEDAAIEEVEEENSYHSPDGSSASIHDSGVEPESQPDDGSIHDSNGDGSKTDQEFEQQDASSKSEGDAEPESEPENIAAPRGRILRRRPLIPPPAEENESE